MSIRVFVPPGGAYRAPAGLALRRRLARLSELVERWIERRRQRRALLALSDSLLKDIGLGRADAEHEARKPFWRQ